MAKKKIKRRKLPKAILEKRKQFEMDTTDSIYVVSNKIKTKIPNKEERKEYIKALIEDFDKKLQIA